MTVDERRKRLEAEGRSLVEARAAVAAGQDIALDELETRVAEIGRAHL